MPDRDRGAIGGDLVSGETPWPRLERSYMRGPVSGLLRGYEPEAKCDHHVQVGMGDIVLLPIQSSCSERPYNCFLIQLYVFRDMLDMLADCPLASPNNFPS